MRSSIKKKLPEGKLPIEVLNSLLRSFPAGKSGNIVVPPGVGVDVGVTKVNGKYLVVSSDPITGTVENIGWHAVNVSANDVATSGVMPDALSIVSLFPSGYALSRITRIFHQIEGSAEKLGIVVVGGHTEVTPKLKRPIIVVTCFGTGSKYLTAAMAKENDSILITKVVGIEGTSILSRLKKVRNRIDLKTAKRGEKMIMLLSILPEARAASLTGRIHAMHDMTEGGLIGSLVEMSIASNLGFELDVESVPIDISTKKICAFLHLDPLKLIGSGSLVISCPKRYQDIVVKEVQRAGVRCTRIGNFVSKKRGRTLLNADGSLTRIKETSIQDELWPALKKFGNLS